MENESHFETEDTPIVATHWALRIDGEFGIKQFDNSHDADWYVETMLECGLDYKAVKHKSTIVKYCDEHYQDYKKYLLL